MLIPLSIGRIIKISAIVTVLAISVIAAGSSARIFSPQDKAFYADANTLNFVRPGLVLKVTSASVAADGTIKANIRITDPKGVPLDRDGIVTPGPVSISCVAAYIPKGQTQYTSYTTRIQSSTITNTSATQAGTDSGGTWAKTADGEYTYTFKTKAPATFDKMVTHAVGCQSSRSLAEFDLGTNYATDVLTFVPDGSPVVTTRDVIRTASCNKCHDALSFHGGSRRGVEYCVMCHQPQTIDPDTGNTVDFPVMVHKIHMGNQLPSVKAGGKYQIIGFNNGVSDWSTVALPTDPGQCTVCHDQKNGAAQAQAYLKPNRAACGACHDNVNFATGLNHVNLPQVSDNNCATCHIPQGELPLDASIMGAHINPATLMPETQDFVPGIIVDNVKVANGTAGSKPTVTFTLKDKAGNPIPLAELKTSPGRIAAVLAGPTTDYGYTNFGSDVTTGGYVSEDIANGGGTCDTSGNCSYTFTHAVPAGAKGTFSIGMEARRAFTILPGTTKAAATEYGAKNVVVNFSVDGSPVTPRRQVVALAKCNQCHTYLSLHGTNRNQIEQCVLCHNPSETDKARRPSATNATDKATPPQAVDFAYMIHRIHTGENLNALGAGYTVVGFGGSHNDFSEVRYPAFSPSGSPGDTRNCSMCHVNGSETNLPVGKAAVTDPQSPVNPLPRTTAVCTGCHADLPTLAHAVTNTAAIGGQSIESCTACHSNSAEFSVARKHAQ